jgi:pantoate--beta-alanine ligase
MQLFKSPLELRQAVTAFRRAGKTIGFVPTMGALHDGHIQLGQAAQKECDVVLYSIFVNPLQFAPHEDFGRYPRTVEADCARLADAGMAGVYLPGVEDMYPKDFLTKVHVDGVSAPLEGEFRPHFFDGVATVVTKLLLQVLPDKAFFGEKDYQQLQVVTRLTKDLNLPLDIVGVPTVRDEQGLALSSRNAYLSPEQLQSARCINVILKEMGAAFRSGKAIPEIEAAALKQLREAGFEKIDYCTIRDARTLQVPEDTTRPLRVLMAAWIGQTRLIDNMAV